MAVPWHRDARPGLFPWTRLGPWAPDPIQCVAAMALALGEADDVSMQFPRITRDPGVMGGRACLRGMRVTAAMIVGQIAAGRSVDDVLGDYPCLEGEDVFEALRYAAWLAGGQDACPGARVVADLIGGWRPLQLLFERATLAQQAIPSEGPLLQVLSW